MRLLIILACSVSFALSAQSLHVMEYGFDASGNQTSRKLRSTGRKGINEDTVKSITSTYQVTIYPNPVSSILNIVIDGLPADTTWSYKLYDLKGLTIAERNINTNRFATDLSGYPLGTYILKLFIRKDQKTFKIIKD